MVESLGPVVAGKFYPGNEDDLIDRIERCYTNKYGPGKLPQVSEGELSSPVGVIAPHAGYAYSGPIAAHSYSWLARFGKPETVVVIGTNHTGLGPPAAVLTEGGWSTPLGEVDFNPPLARKVLKSSRLLEESSLPFNREHSIEVQLPFLQYLWGDEFSIVPICLKSQTQEVASDLGSVLEDNVPEGTLIIASTDFTHYEPQEVAEQKDGRAIEAILDLEISEFYERVQEDNISICGYGSVGVLLSFSLKRNLKPTKLQYATSGEVAGYGREVVGYGAIGFRE